MNNQREKLVILQQILQHHHHNFQMKCFYFVTLQIISGREMNEYEILILKDLGT